MGASEHADLLLLLLCVYAVRHLSQHAGTVAGAVAWEPAIALEWQGVLPAVGASHRRSQLLRVVPPTRIRVSLAATQCVAWLVPHGHSAARGAGSRATCASARAHPELPPPRLVSTPCTTRTGEEGRLQCAVRLGAPPCRVRMLHRGQGSSTEQSEKSPSNLAHQSHRSKSSVSAEVPCRGIDRWPIPSTVRVRVRHMRPSK